MWIRSLWVHGMETLSSECWLTKGQEKIDFLWMPSQKETKIYLELMMDTNLKMLYDSHVVIVPQLLTYLRRKYLYK